MSESRQPTAYLGEFYLARLTTLVGVLLVATALTLAACGGGPQKKMATFDSNACLTRIPTEGDRCRPGRLPWRPLPKKAERLALSKGSVRPGEVITITLARAAGKEELWSLGTGGRTYLQCWTGNEWLTIYALGDNPDLQKWPGFVPYRADTAGELDVAYPVSGPIRVRIPTGLEPGHYRLCKEFVHKWVGGGWLAYGLVRVLPARDPP